MPGVIRIDVTETEAVGLLSVLMDALANARGNVRTAPASDAALVSALFKVQRACAGPEGNAVHHLNLPPWAVKAVMGALVVGGVEFPKPAPAKVRKPKPRKRTRARRVPRLPPGGLLHRTDRTMDQRDFEATPAEAVNS